MEENVAVYTALREHILQKENQIANETIYMYVTYFALLAIGSIWNSWFSLVSFISLIVFQSMINGDQFAVTKASLYIRIFFETKRNDIHWEQLHQDPYCLSVISGTVNKTVGWYICKYGATILSILSFLSIIIPILHDSNYHLYALTSVETIRSIIAFILCSITIYMNKLYFTLRDNKNSNEKLAQAIEAFYKTVKEESISNISTMKAENHNDVSQFSKSN